MGARWMARGQESFRAVESSVPKKEETKADATVMTLPRM
jgi:hypothetical protein